MGLRGDDFVEFLDVRMAPDDIDALVDGKMYFPGHHMNKKHRCTIFLDGSVPIGEIFQRIDTSHELAMKRK